MQSVRAPKLTHSRLKELIIAIIVFIGMITLGFLLATVTFSWHEWVIIAIVVLIVLPGLGTLFHEVFSYEASITRKLRASVLLLFMCAAGYFVGLHFSPLVSQRVNWFLSAMGILYSTIMVIAALGEKELAAMEKRLLTVPVCVLVAIPVSFVLLNLYLQNVLLYVLKMIVLPQAGPLALSAINIAVWEIELFFAWGPIILGVFVAGLALSFLAELFLSFLIWKIIGKYLFKLEKASKLLAGEGKEKPKAIVARTLVEKITPLKGKVGQTAVVYGSGFYGGPVKVMLGKSQAQNVETLDNRTVKFTVPNRNALDSNPLKVKVIVGEVPATGDLEFFYDSPRPSPVITGFDPPAEKTGLPIRVTIYGTYLTTPQGRMPTQIYLIGPENIKGTITGSVTGTSFKAKFPAIAEIGIYMFIVGFNDGSGADAYGFEVT